MSKQFKCPKCGRDTSVVAAGIYCPKCDVLLDSTGQPIVPNYGTAANMSRAPKSLAPPVGEFDVWIPILLLVAMFFLGFLSFWLSVFALVGATLYVHSNSKKFGIGGGRAVITLLFSIIGLPLYAYDLHKLRKAQRTSQLERFLEPTAPAATPSTAQQVPATSPPTKFCRHCGAKIPRNSAYCEECGEKLL
jgi:ribosomal protein L40E